MHTAAWIHWSEYDWKHESHTIRHRSAGYFAQATSDDVTVVQSYNDLWEQGHPKIIDAIMTIPRKAITKFTVLKRAFNERNRKT